MRVLLQRVRKAEVEVAGKTVAAIDYGMLIFVGVEARDCERDFEWMASKLCKLRIVPDDAGVMNRSVLEVGGQILAVSQFTLFASYQKGNRPSWGRAAPGEISKPRFEDFVARLEKLSGLAVPSGVFGADMQVHLINDGPVTLLLDSQAPE